MGHFHARERHEDAELDVGGTKDGEFKLTAVLKRSCGNGQGGGGPDEYKDLDLWGGTVVSIDSVSWEAIDSPLDTNPNAGGGLRIFPDKIAPNDTVSRKRVRVKAKVTPIKKDVKVYFQSFDVDDPSTDAYPLDATDQLLQVRGGDNRGMPHEGNLNTTSTMTDENGFATVELTTTMQPGDNFRVAAGLALTDLLSLNNDNVLANNNSSPGVFGSNAKLTPMLTVWRRLHVEADSMEAITGDYVEGNIKGILIDQDDRHRAELSVNLALNDKSPNLDSAPPGTGNGRFENGSVEIGAIGHGETTLKLQGNGNNYIATNPGARFVLDGTLSLGPNDPAPRSVSIIGYQHLTTVPGPAAAFQVIANPPLPVDAYKNGTFEVNTQQFTIAGNTEDRIQVVEDVELQFHLQDDDYTGALPRMPDVGEEVASLFRPAYILPVVDGGGSLANNKDNVPILLNISDELVPAFMDIQGNFESRQNKADDFWIAYVLSGFQSGASPEENEDGVLVGDNDPDGEAAGTALGVSVPDIGGSLIFVENMRDTGNNDSEQRVITHEFGHLFGLGHTGGIMGDATIATAKFTDSQLDTIRSRPNSP